MGDKTQAEALRLARKHLVMMGRRHTPGDIGKTAGIILNAMQAQRQALKEAGE